MSCGWCQIKPSEFEKQQTMKLIIHGGSPFQSLEIASGDIHQQRSGIRGTFSKLGGSSGSTLEVSIRPHKVMKEESQYHMEMLPQLCILNKRLLYFITGFRNYVG
jgi:hypothetical protein